MYIIYMQFCRSSVFCGEISLGKMFSSVIMLSLAKSFVTSFMFRHVFYGLKFSNICFEYSLFLICDKYYLKFCYGACYRQQII